MKRVVKKKCKRSSKLLLESLKNLPFRSDHRHHMMQSGTIFQTTALQERPPVHQHCKRFTTPQGIAHTKPKRLKKAFHKNWAYHMKKQMINGFLIPFAHPTPIDQHHIFLPQIVQHENLAKGSRPNEESHPR